MAVDSKPYNVLANSKDVVWVKPELVIEVEAEDIQKSPRYKLGYALRFPRFKRVRNDKTPYDATKCSELISLYNKLYGESS